MPSSSIRDKWKEELRAEIIAEYLAEQKNVPKYTTRLYHYVEAPEGKDFSFSNIEELEPLYKKNWVDSPAKLGVFLSPIHEEKDTSNREPPLLPGLIHGQVTRLLKGHRLNNKTGLSLASFCSLYKGDAPEYKKREELKPLFDKVLAFYDGKIYKKIKGNLDKYFFIGVVENECLGDSDGSVE